MTNVSSRVMRLPRAAILLDCAIVVIASASKLSLRESSETVPATPSGRHFCAMDSLGTSTFLGSFRLRVICLTGPQHTIFREVTQGIRVPARGSFWHYPDWPQVAG